jgi:hypothetical protein
MSYHALIYVHTITPRIQYIANFLSGYYNADFGVTSSQDRYKSSEVSCKINYSSHRIIKDEIWIHPHVLLFEASVRQVKIQCFEYNGLKAFFPAESDFRFDLFAAIFYLITRYEEYLPYKKDAYGRYAHENSLAFKENFLHIPLVNLWLEDFRQLLQEKDIIFKSRRKFLFRPTYDIDIAWSFRNKKFYINAGGFARDLLKGNWKNLSERIKVVKGEKPDPFDSYEWMDSIHKLYQLEPVYFFLVAKERGKYDKNIDVNNIEFNLLIHTISRHSLVGLHPSWASSLKPSLVNEEKQTLEKIISRPVISSRQHYIKFQPSNFQGLRELNIKEEYSMGYGSINGFRASFCNPYYWYNLKEDKETDLRIHPFCFMDANAYYEQRMSSNEALDQLKEFYKQILAVKGTMITIFHNSFLGTSNEFSGWKEMYASFIQGISS